MLKNSVQCVKEINLFHSDIAVIILHYQKLISHNLNPYLSITHRIFLVKDFFFLNLQAFYMGCHPTYIFFLVAYC
jgi:hypothetical protein